MLAQLDGAREAAETVSKFSSIAETRLPPPQALCSWYTSHEATLSSNAKSRHLCLGGILRKWTVCRADHRVCAWQQVSGHAERITARLKLQLARKSTPAARILMRSGLWNMSPQHLRT